MSAVTEILFFHLNSRRWNKIMVTSIIADVAIARLWAREWKEKNKCNHF